MARYQRWIDERGVAFYVDEQGKRIDEATARNLGLSGAAKVVDIVESRQSSSDHPDVYAELVESFQRMGLSDEEAQIAASGRGTAISATNLSEAFQCLGSFGRASGDRGSRTVKENSTSAQKNKAKKTGFRGPSPDVGKATRFQPGVSGNPGGRPRKFISEAYERLAFQRDQEDKHGRTYAELLAEAQFREAIKGKTQAAREMTDRLEGKATQPIELSNTDEQHFKLNLTVKFTDPEDEDQPGANRSKEHA